MTLWAIANFQDEYLFDISTSQSFERFICPFERHGAHLRADGKWTANVTVGEIWFIMPPL